MFKKLLNWWRGSNTESDQLNEIKAEFITVLGVLIYAYNGELTIQNEIIQAFLQSNMLPKVEYMENGDIKMWLEEIENE